MAVAFASELEVVLVRGREKSGRQVWRVVKPLIFASDIAGRIEVPAGFETDFSSVPRLPLAYLLAGDTAHEAAVIHDWLYESPSVSKATADAVFLEAMEASGVSWWRRKLMYQAVSWFGGQGQVQGAVQ